MTDATETVREYLRTHGLDAADVSVAELAGELANRGLSPAGVRDALAELGDDTTRERATDQPPSPQGETDEPADPFDRDADGYIDDPDFQDTERRVRDYYRRVRPALDELGRFDNRFIGVAGTGNAGWYDHLPVTDPEQIEAGWDVRSRALTFDRDLAKVIERTDDGDARTIYNATSWKDASAVYDRTLGRRTDAGKEWAGDVDNPLPDYGDLRAWGFWVDLDLHDHLKPQRGALDDDTRETIEAVAQAMIEEVAALYDVPQSAVYGLDSGGGAYIYGPPEATAPIADEFDGDDRAVIFKELRDRLQSWSGAMWERVAEQVDGAADVADPDFVQNKNRKSKAPLALHADHDLAVTPLRTRDQTGDVVTGLKYTPTLPSEVDDGTITAAERWAAGLTTAEHTDAVSALVRTLWADVRDEGDEWADTLRRWLDQREQAQAAQQARDDASAAAADRRDRETDTDVSITPDHQEVRNALDQLDADDVAGNTIVGEWTEDLSDATDRSSAGNKAFVPTWASSYNSGNASIVDSDKWNTSGETGVSGGVVEMAAIASEDTNVDPGDDVRGDDYGAALEKLRSLDYDVPVYTPDAETPEPETGEPYGTMPLWSLRRAAVELDVIDADEFVERESDDGGTYLGFPDTQSYQQAVLAVEAAGLETGRTDDVNGGEWPEVTLSPATVHEAAGSLTPADLDGELTYQGEPLADDDRTGWADPHTGETITATVAAALDASITTPGSHALDSPEWSRAYRHLREQFAAPVPEYVDRKTAGDRRALVFGALDVLTFNHLDTDALASDVTARGDDVGGDATLALDPAWRDSESGRSVVVYPDGTIYEAHPSHSETIDPLRFVALDAGLISWPDYVDAAPGELLSGDAFRRAYQLAREEYGAPLPRYELPDSDHTVVLPAADELTDAAAVGDDALERARDATEELVADALTTSDTPQVVTTLPSLGKTTSAVKQADRETPVTYLAQRKELQAEAVERADEFGAHAMVLPVLADNHPGEKVIDAGVAAVRDHPDGTGLLRDRDALLAAIEERIDREVPDPCEWGDDNADEPDLQRATCPVADGAHGVEWAVAVHVAHSLRLLPRVIHSQARELFGERVPCDDPDCDHEHGSDPSICPTGEAWNRVRSADESFDLLVGHPVHAHTASARRYDYRDRDTAHASKPRALVVDEYPGDVWAADYGTEWTRHAAWLAQAFGDDLDSVEAVTRRASQLWNDETVRAWLRDDETPEPHDTLAERVGLLYGVVDGDDTALQTARHRVGDDDARTVADRLADALRADVGDADRVAGPLAGVVDTACDRVSEWVAGETEWLRPTLDTLDAARDALRGGRAGVERLAIYDTDPYAAPDAGALLWGLLAPSDGEHSQTLTWDSAGFGDVPDDETVTAKRVEMGRVTVLTDQDHAGASVHRPPSRDGGNVPLVGLDATARASLWRASLGEQPEIRDIHDSPRERRAFLRDQMGIQVVRTTDDAKTYGGSCEPGQFDGDTALVEQITADHDRQPTVVTTKSAEEAAGERFEAAGAQEVDHYGNLKGSNRFGERRLAAILGCQHHGDGPVERAAAWNGEQVERTGHGLGLDYGCETGNDYLRHAWHDDVLQAILRFGRDAGGAVVYAHTAALRDDVPVVAEGQVAETYSDAETAVAEVAADLAPRRFTVSDVVGELRARLDDPPHRRTVQRALATLASDGALDRHDPGAGRAADYGHREAPGAGQTELPDLAAPTPDETCDSIVYTWSVGVHGGETPPDWGVNTTRPVIPAPDTASDGVAVGGPPD